MGARDYAPSSMSVEASRRDGAMNWMSPCIAFSIVVGLGLDYDIFLMESVVEAYDEGASEKQAVVHALDATGAIICVAGVIMTL